MESPEASYDMFLKRQRQQQTPVSMYVPAENKYFSDAYSYKTVISLVMVIVILLFTVIWLSFSKDDSSVPPTNAHVTQMKNDMFTVQQYIHKLQQQIDNLEATNTQLLCEIKSIKTSLDTPLTTNLELN
jgi:peptidoglycan hydrolase CwlO-like protein